MTKEVFIIIDQSGAMLGLECFEARAEADWFREFMKYGAGESGLERQYRKSKVVSARLDWEKEQ